jgi:hypothetical protein
MIGVSCEFFSRKSGVEFWISSEKQSNEVVVEGIEFDEGRVAGKGGVRVHDGEVVVIVGERIRVGIGDGVRGVAYAVVVSVFAAIVAPVIAPAGVGVTEIPVVVVRPGVDEVIIGEGAAVVAEEGVVVEEVVVAVEEGDASAGVLADGVVADDAVAAVFEHDAVGVFVHGVVGDEAVEGVV